MNPNKSDGQEKRIKIKMQQREQAKVQKDRHKSDGQERRREAEMQRREKAKVQRERLQEFKKSRDPIFDAIYISMEKTRKWIVFIGVVIIASVVIGILVALASAVGQYL